MKKTITTKELEIPIALMTEIVEMIVDNSISHVLIGADTEEDTITIEVDYEREERAIIHAIEDLIEDYQENMDDEMEEDEENEQ